MFILSTLHYSRYLPIHSGRLLSLYIYAKPTQAGAKRRILLLLLLLFVLIVRRSLYSNNIRTSVPIYIIILYSYISLTRPRAV